VAALVLTSGRVVVVNADCALLSSPIQLCSRTLNLRRRPNIAVAALVVTSGRVVLVNADRALSAHRWAPPSGAFTFSAGGASAAEAPFALEPDPAPPRYVWTTKSRKKKNKALRRCTAGRADAAERLTPSCPGKLSSAGTNISSSACVLACRVLGSPFAADLDAALWAQRYAVLPGGRLLASCGYWDCSVR